MPQGESLIIPLTKQVFDLAEEQLNNLIDGSTKATVAGILILVIIGQLVGGKIFKYLWSFFNNFQLLVYVDSFNISLPSNV